MAVLEDLSQAGDRLLQLSTSRSAALQHLDDAHQNVLAEQLLLMLDLLDGYQGERDRWIPGVSDHLSQMYKMLRGDVS